MPTTAIAGVHAVACLTVDADLPGVGITVIFVVADVCRQPPAVTSVFAVARSLQILVSLLLLMSLLLLAPMLFLVFLPSVTGVSLDIGFPTCARIYRPIFFFFRDTLAYNFRHCCVVVTCIESLSHIFLFCY
jgi:hypothetical protein